ncbi:MAG: hypothetical protein OEM61_12915, partial [Desulfobacteraceae bacterium]|nr:hypothetical protein [Desulfobacteraceae bacterium]
WEETQATISSNGKKIIWASNWGNNVGTEQLFVMQLETPPSIYQGAPILPSGGMGLPWLILLLGN